MLENVKSVFLGWDQLQCSVFNELLLPNKLHKL